MDTVAVTFENFMAKFY